MLHNLPDGSIVALHSIVAISPIYIPTISGNDISKLDSRPRFQIFTTGGHLLTIVSEKEKEVTLAREQLVEQWEKAFNYNVENPEKIN